MRYFFIFILVFLSACGGQTKEELLQEGNHLREQGNYRGAIVLYKNALEKDANFIDARFELGNVYLLAGDYKKAENEFQKVEHQNPSFSEVSLKLAAVYLQQHQGEKALLQLDKYHSSHKETAESLTLYGRAQGALGDLDYAEKLFNKALLLDENAIEPRLHLATIYLQKKDPQRAKAYLQEIIALDNKHASAHYMLASIESQSGHPDEALKTYQQLIAVKPDEVFAHFMAALLTIDKGDLDSAEKLVSNILKKFPDRAEGYQLKGMLLFKKEQFADAVTSFEKSLSMEQHLLSYFFLGLSYYKLEQYELALNQFQKALDLSPDFGRARILVAMTLLKQKRANDAIIEIERVLKTHPNNAYARNIHGSALLAVGRYDEGMEELETASELDPTLADVHLKKGIFHLAKGEAKQGELDLLKAVDAAPEVANSRLMLVSLYMRQKNYTAAVQTLQDGLEGGPADALLYNYLAAAFFAQHKSDDAVAALNKAIAAKPDYLTPYFNLASYYVAKTEYDKAITNYEQILSQSSQNLKALLGLAAIYNLQNRNDDLNATYRRIEATGTEQGFVIPATYHLRLGDLDEALAIADRGLVAFDSSPSLLEIKAFIHYRKKQMADAEAAYTKMAVAAPERGNRLLISFYLSNKQPAKAKKVVDELLQGSSDKDYTYLLASDYYRSQGDRKMAMQVLQKGIDIVKPATLLQMQLAGIYQGLNQSAQAEQIYQRIIEDSPRYAPAYAALGTLKEIAGDKAAALELYRTSLRYDPNNLTSLNNMAYLLIDNFGQAQEALGHAMTAYRMQPNDPRIMDTLGYALLVNKRVEDANTILAKAYEMLPDEQAVALHLARAKKELGQKEEARKLLQGVLAAGNSAEKQEANSLLQTL